MYDLSIFIFHRSLRLIDNIGLYDALIRSTHVIPIFIMTPEQITTKNKYKSDNGINFMIEALEDLSGEIKKINNLSKLYIFYGSVKDCLTEIIESKQLVGRLDAIFVNQDYTKYAMDREEIIMNICTDHSLDMISHEDVILHEIHTIRSGSGDIYTKFTPFYNTAIKLVVDRPLKKVPSNFFKHLDNCFQIKQGKLLNAKALEKIRKKLDISPKIFFIGTRKEALKKLALIRVQENYSDTRNDLTIHTTNLSPYIKFGLVSIREVYHRINLLFGKSHDLIKQLYWREFYTIICYFKPEIFYGKSLKEKYDLIRWNKNNRYYELWCSGKTGFPIVDAGMRELNMTGNMHNRTRLIVSNFLVKLLHIDWREGERYFAQKLVDYDPCVNNGNWQWTSGSGADSQPYFRIFNPWLQSEKHDKECKYIKHWISELNDVDPSHLHRWYVDYKEYPDILYPKPMINQDIEKKISVEMYSTIFA